MTVSWHKNYSPQNFLSRINIENFLDKNQIIEECYVDSINKHCILCNQLGKDGILLNNKSFLCSECFKKLIYIQYQEKYEILRRKYIKEKTAREHAKKAFIDSRISIKIAGYSKVAGYITFILVLIKYH